MPWRGYNFEDAILVSEKMVKDDYYTSIHIEEFEIEARDTKLGPEEITRDIPNVSEGFLKDLDDSGIIRIGAYVKPGDILVGKVTPKGETQLTPEEKLLRAIFGEKAGDVRDASLICPPGIEGIIVGVKIFSRKGIEKDDRAKAIEQEELDMMEKNLQDEVRILHDEVKKRVIMMIKGTELRADLFDEYGRERLHKKGTALTQDVLQEMSYDTMIRLKIQTDDTRLEDELNELEHRTERQVEVIKNLFEEKKEKIRRGDELPPGVIKLVKVYVAMKRKLSVGDKMAGRHGNKGVIARILPEEDMPHLPDGTPVEIVLNPLGVPSRMNVGQILETHLGWAAAALGVIDRLLQQRQDEFAQQPGNLDQNQRGCIPADRSVGFRLVGWNPEGPGPQALDDAAHGVGLERAGPVTDPGPQVGPVDRRHEITVGRDAPTITAISVLANPSAADSTILARITRQYGSV